MGILQRWDRHNERVIKQQFTREAPRWLEKLDERNQDSVERTTKASSTYGTRNWWPLVLLLLFLPLENLLYFLVVGGVLVVFTIRWACRRRNSSRVSKEDEG